MKKIKVVIYVDENEVYGMVALLEDSYIMRRQIYDKVFEELNIDENSEEANYIKAHIDVPVSQEEREKVINSVNMLFNALRL